MYFTPVVLKIVHATNRRKRRDNPRRRVADWRFPVWRRVRSETVAQLNPVQRTNRCATHHALTGTTGRLT